MSKVIHEVPSVIAYEEAVRQESKPQPWLEETV